MVMKNADPRLAHRIVYTPRELTYNMLIGEYTRAPVLTTLWVTSEITYLFS